MNIKLNLIRPLFNVGILVFLLMTSLKLTGQEKKPVDLKDFKIIIENTEKGIKMQSSQGTAWLNLEFSILNNQPQAIDEYGMTNLTDLSAVKDAKRADFLFTISKIKNTIILKGIEGTAWTDLRFSLSENGKQEINQFGMLP